MGITKFFYRIIQKDWEIYLLKLLTLSIAFASSILIISFTANEFTVDRYHHEAHELFRLLLRYEGKEYEGRNRFSNRIPLDVYEYLNERTPTARVKTLSLLSVIAESNAFNNETVHIADAAIASLFSFEVLNGSTNGLTNDQYGALISVSCARRYFGNETALGKMLRVFTSGDTVSFKVIAVYRDFPPNSSENFNAFLIWNTAALNALSYNANDFTVYGRLRGQQRDSIASLVTLRFGQKENISYRLQSMPDTYFGPRVIGEDARHGDAYSVMILVCITGLIFFLAITNFVNLSTLTLPGRAKEFALKKVSGASRVHIFSTLLAESLLLTTVAFILGVGILLLTLKPLQSVLAIDLQRWLMETNVIGGLSIAMLFLIVAGAPLYPAFKFIRASPNRLLSSEVITFPRLKRVITILQLGISISLIVAGIIIQRQIGRSLIKEPGRNHDQVVYVSYPPEITALERLKGSWEKNHPNIVDVSATSHLPDNLRSKELGSECYVMKVDKDFLDFFEIRLKKGRWFKVNDDDSVVINEKASDLHLAKPGVSIGTMENFAARYNQPDQAVKIVMADDYNYLCFRILEVDIRETLDYLSRFFKEYTGRDIPVSFFDHRFRDTLEYENRLNRLSAILSTVAGVIACCSIYALSLSRIRDSMKQIAIRKTFGANNYNIILMLSFDFLQLLLGAVFFFGPLTFILLREWLRNFVYSTHLTWSDPLVALGICISIVMLTNGLLIVRLSKANIMATLKA